MSWTSRHYELICHDCRLLTLICNSQSYATVHKAGVAMLQSAVLNRCSLLAEWISGKRWWWCFLFCQYYHKLLPISAFGSCCITVRKEIPLFSSVAKTTVPWPSTALSSSWPSSVVLSNCSPSSARCGSASTLGIIVETSFYAKTTSPQHCSRLVTTVDSRAQSLMFVIPTSAAVYRHTKQQRHKSFDQP